MKWHNTFTGYLMISLGSPPSVSVSHICHVVLLRCFLLFFFKRCLNDSFMSSTAVLEVGTGVINPCFPTPPPPDFFLLFFPFFEGVGVGGRWYSVVSVYVCMMLCIILLSVFMTSFFKVCSFLCHHLSV